MTNILKKICENKKIELIESKKRCSFSSLQKILHDKTNRGFNNLLIKYIVPPKKLKL